MTSDYSTHLRGQQDIFPFGVPGQLHYPGIRYTPPSLVSRYPRAQIDGDLSASPSCTGSLFRRSSFIHDLRSHHRDVSGSLCPLPAPEFSRDPPPIFPQASVVLPPAIHSLSRSFRWAICGHQVGNIRGRTPAAAEPGTSDGRRGPLGEPRPFMSSGFDEDEVHYQCAAAELCRSATRSQLLSGASAAFLVSRGQPQLGS